VRTLYSPEVGEELELPETVRSIVSLTPSVTEVLVELGLVDRVVAVSAWCRLLALAKGYGAVLSKPVAGTYDSIVADVVRGADLILLAGGAQRKLVSELRKLNLRYYVANLPKSAWGIAEAILQVAAAVNEIHKGLELAKKFTRELSYVAGTAEPIKTYVELNLGGPVLPGLFTHIVTGLELLGLNVLNKAVLRPYIYGREVLELSAKLMERADLVIYEDSTLKPSEEKIIKELKRRCGVEPENVVVLPVMTLTDFGPKFPAELSKLAELI